MSFFLGLAKGFMWAQEQKQEREQFEADMAWERERLLLSAKLSRQNAAYASRLEREQDKAELIKRATALGFSPESIKLFDSQGSLEILVDRAAKSGSAEYVQRLMNYATQYGLSEEQAARTVGDAAASGDEDLEGAVTERLISPLSIKPPVSFSGTDADRIRRIAMTATANANPNVSLIYGPNNEVSFDYSRTGETERLNILDQVAKLTIFGENFVANNSIPGEELNFGGLTSAMFNYYPQLLAPPPSTDGGDEDKLEDTGNNTSSNADMGITVPTTNLPGINPMDIR